MRRLLFWVGLLLVFAGGAIGSTYWWWFKAPHTLTPNVVYGQRDNKPLVMNVFQPPNHNGAGVILMVSGGWKSGPGSIRPFLFAPFLRRGYTVFAVQHISQPECLIGEIVDDVLRSVRFIRHHAADYKVNPDQLGVIGGSSGGHLSLMLGTRGGPGDPLSADEIDRESSAVLSGLLKIFVNNNLNGFLGAIVVNQNSQFVICSGNHLRLRGSD